MRVTCSICDGTGWLTDEATRSARPCRCRPQRIAQQKARVLSAIIPQRYADVAFERPPVVDMPSGLVSTARRYVRQLDRNLDEGRGLWLTGGTGTGKTSLAMLVSKSALEAGRTVAVYSLPKLLAEIRQTYADDATVSYSGLISRLTAVDLLHLDDLGAEQTSEWVLEQLYTIVNARYEDERALLITSNSEPPELIDQIGVRTVSRMVEMCELVPVDGDDHRQQRKPDRPIEEGWDAPLAPEPAPAGRGGGYGRQRVSSGFTEASGWGWDES